MKRPLAMAAVVLLMAVLGVGCSHSSTACSGPEDSVNICVNGRRIAFEADAQPHMHETGSLYAPVDVLARRLGLDVRTVISGDGQSALVTVNRKPFAPAMAHGSKGVHVHQGTVYVPLREFAAAAGLELDMSAETRTAGFARK